MISMFQLKWLANVNFSCFTCFKPVNWKTITNAQVSMILLTGASYKTLEQNSHLKRLAMYLDELPCS